MRISSLALLVFATMSSPVALAQTCNGFHGSDFEAPAFTGTAGGTLLTGQNAYYLPSASADFNVYTYAGNALGLPQNPNGGSQFISGTGPGTSTFARAQKDIVYPSTGTVTFGFDIAATFTGTLPASQNVGSFSVQPSPGSSSFIALAAWTDPATAAAWNADFAWFDSAGTPLTESVSDPGFQNLPVNTWYRWEIDVNFTDNKILQIRLTDIVAGTTVTNNPVGRYMDGGTAGTGQPTGFRFFAGASDPAGNTLGFDNLCLSAAGFFAPSNDPIGLGSVLGSNDISLTLNEDETYMIFASDRPGGAGGYDLYQTWRPDVLSPWAPPVPLPPGPFGPVNTPADEWQCNLVAVAFPGAAQDLYELNFARHSGGVSNISFLWINVPGNSAHEGVAYGPSLAFGVNQVGWAISDPYVTDDALTMFYTTDAGGTAAGGTDIHTATRTTPGVPWVPQGPFAPANSASADHSPVPDANGNFLWFASDRPGGSGGSSDVYVTFYEDPANGTWTTPIEASNLNTAGDERNMWRRGVTNRMYYTRSVAGSDARLYCDDFGVAGTRVRYGNVRGVQTPAVPLDPGVEVRAWGSPWPMAVNPVRTYRVQRDSVLLIDVYDSRPQPVGALYALLMSGRRGVQGILPPFLPNLELGTMLLNPNYLFTHAIATGSATRQATFSLPTSVVLPGIKVSYQAGILNGFPAPGQPVIVWGEPGYVIIP